MQSHSLTTLPFLLHILDCVRKRDVECFREEEGDDASHHSSTSIDYTGQSGQHLFQDQHSRRCHGAHPGHGGGKSHSCLSAGGGGGEGEEEEEESGGGGCGRGGGEVGKLQIKHRNT